EALEMVVDGRVDAYVGEADIAVYKIKEYGFDTLRYSGQTEYIGYESFGLTKGNEPFVQILTKAMATIPKSEADAIFNRWMNVKSGIKQETIVKYGLAIALILLFFIYRNSILKKYNLNLKNAGIQLENEAKEKELLFQELDHRVKNNLQIISSIVSLHSSKDDTSQALEDINNTISAIALAHDKLHQNSIHNTLELNNYISVLLDNLLSSSILEIEKEVHSPLIYLNAQQSITLGLIINEFVSNSIKYAFDGISTPKISVDIKENGDFLTLLISDNGIGFQEDKQSSGLGMEIIKTLAKSKFKTDVQFFHNNGTFLELKIALK
ncbi:MAG: histidine kinase dimerization/phosphoacceptor domain -containing protein, partial [Arcobacteraceae bacterium]|nr:histidine kinase dimerization/phosphoacceptor domain -containing protein [Arcobacteraceae bacterium]